MQTKLPIITHQECIRLCPGHNLDENHNICTFDTTGRRSACAGDEGGPLVFDDRLLGIFTGWLPRGYPNIFINFNNVNMHNLVHLVHIRALRRVH